MTVRELLSHLAGAPPDARVQIRFTEEVPVEAPRDLEDFGPFEAFDTYADVAAVTFDSEENTVTLEEEAS